MHVASEQCLILDPTPEDLTIREIMMDAGGDGATKRLARRKLDAAGAMNSWCCDATDEKRMGRLKAALHLAKSLAEISTIVEVEAVEAKKALEDEFRE